MTQTSINFDIVKARERRDEGMKRAADHSGADWQERAYRFLKWYIYSGDQKKTFIIEDVRQMAKSLVSLEDPPHLRAWGSPVARLAKEGLIKRVGYTQVKNVKAHMANCAVWQKVIPLSGSVSAEVRNFAAEGEV